MVPYCAVDLIARSSITFFFQVRYLVEAGADVRSQSAAGGTALSLAEQGGHMQVVNFLKEHSVNSSVSQQARLLFPFPL